MLLYILVCTTIFSVSYTLYYELTNDDIHFVKHFANLIGVLTGPLGIFLLKYSKNINKIFLLLQVLSILLISTSTFFSGGIYSVDLMWILVIMISSFLLNGTENGVVIMFLAIAVIFIYYLLNYFGVKDFQSEGDKLGAGYKVYSLTFIIIITSGFTYFFVNATRRTKQELDEIKERHLKSLDYKYKYITDNANEIIALHTENGHCTFISVAIKNILGFETEEMIGCNYAALIGTSFQNRQIECFTKMGSTVWLEITFNMIKDEVGNGEVCISIARDITDKMLEDKKMAILRQQIANDFHDEMGNKLASITLNSTILALQAKDNSELSNTIAKIENTSKELYQHSRDFIWSIDSKSDELQEIFIYLKDFSQDFLESLSINLIIAGNIFELKNKLVLSAYSGRHIVLIIKEVVTNAAKHSKCTSLFLNLTVTEESFLFVVKDNGTGIPIDRKSGNGMRSIQLRAKTIDCELAIKTSDQGTEVSLLGKLPKLGDRNSSLLT